MDSLNEGRHIVTGECQGRPCDGRRHCMYVLRHVFNTFLSVSCQSHCLVRCLSLFLDLLSTCLSWFHTSPRDLPRAEPTA